MSAVPPPQGLEPLPDPTSHDTAVVDRAAPAEVESEWGRGGSFVLVHPTVNGRDIGWFILDSGASGSTITAQAARAAGLDAAGTTRIQGTEVTTVFRCRELRVGPLRFEGIHLTGLDMHRSSQAFGREIAGILGRNVFESAVVVLDGPSRTVRLHDPAAADAVAGAVSASAVEWLPITMVRELPQVPVTFAGDHSGSFILDTGADASIHFFHGTVTECGLLQSPGVHPAGTKTQVTFGSRATVRDGTIDDLRIGSRQVGPISATFAEPGDAPSRRLEGSDGLVGMGLMRRFVVVVDEPGARVAFVTPGRPG